MTSNARPGGTTRRTPLHREQGPQPTAFDAPGPVFNVLDARDYLEHQLAEAHRQLVARLAPARGPVVRPTNSKGSTGPASRPDQTGGTS